MIPKFEDLVHFRNFHQCKVKYNGKKFKWKRPWANTIDIDIPEYHIYIYIYIYIYIKDR